MLRHNPVKLAPLAGKENAFQSKSGVTFRDANFEPQSKPALPLRNKKSHRQKENRQNLIFSKSATKSRFGTLERNPLEAGFGSRSKSPIAVNFNSKFGGKSFKKKQEISRWK